MSNALAEFEAVLNPAAEHRIVEEQSQAIMRSDIGQGLGDGVDEDDTQSG